MRIAHFAPDIWSPGGISSYIRRVGDAQEKRGHNVRYLTFPSRFTDERPTETVQDTVALYSAVGDADVLHLHQDVPSLEGNTTPLLRTMHENQAACPSGSRYLRERRAPCSRRAGIVPCAWGLLVDRCGSVKPRSLRRYRQRYSSDRRVLPQIHTHTVSDFLRDRMVEAGYPGDRIHTLLHPIPEDVDPDPDPPRDGLARFLFVGRVVPSKGLQWLLESVASSQSQFEIDVAGDGFQLEAMKKHASDLGIAGRVRFHGWQDRSVISGLLRDCRAVVFPSLWHEPAGLVTLEAAGAGRAVIASRVGGIPEYAHESFARLIEPYDIRGLAGALDVLATDVTLATRRGAAAGAFARAAGTMNEYLDKLEGLYRIAMQENTNERN